MEVFTSTELQATRAAVPVLDRSNGGIVWSFIAYTWKLVITWLQFTLSLNRWEILHWTIGQTRQALLRDSFPIFLTRCLKRPIVISIHGSTFMEWTRHDRLGRYFFDNLVRSEMVTVLGETQKKHLIEQGIPSGHLVILPNCCEFDPMTEPELERKLDRSSDTAFTVMFLSSLIDSKGYPVFIEAIEHLAADDKLQLKAILCGRLTGSQFASRFPTLNDAKHWIEEKITRINESKHVRISWINGAWGEEKKQLYRAADIFCLPTTYRVEAQPLVLLEAASQGCALVSTQVGEIPSTFTKAECLFLETVSAAEIALIISKLHHDNSLLRNAANRAWKRYRTDYTRVNYKDKWSVVFLQLSGPYT